MDNIELINNKTLQEARVLKMPNQMRNIFALICIYNNPANPLQLWEEFKADMMADFLDDERTSEYLTLHKLNDIFMDNGTSYNKFGLPEPERQPPVNDDQNVPDLNAEQSEVFEFAIDKIENPNTEGAGICIEGPSGTGKTFLINKLYSYLRDSNITTSCAAYTGTASTLLPGGRTLHSLFNLKKISDKNFDCEVPPESDHEDQLKNTKVFMFDGFSMISRYILEAIECYLRKITGNKKRFGGKIVLLFGDFRQLPSVKKISKEIAIDSCIKKSHLWEGLDKKYLTENMRVDPNEATFSDWLLKLGNGDLSSVLEDVPSDSIDIDSCVTNDNFVDKIFGNYSEEEMTKRVILSPTNDACDKLNEKVLKRVSGKPRLYDSEDSKVNEKEALWYIEEYDNNMPPDCLKLKKGAIVMLLRNISIDQGLCKGIRMKVLSLHDYCVKALLLTGSHKGSEVLIPKIKLKERGTDLLRIQFPLKLAYSMTIHLAQGQTFDKVGLYLPKPVFVHGQLYVAFSTVRSFENIKVKVKQQGNEQGKKGDTTYTKNVVYQELLE